MTYAGEARWMSLWLREADLCVVFLSDLLSAHASQFSCPIVAVCLDPFAIAPTSVITAPGRHGTCGSYGV